MEWSWLSSMLLIIIITTLSTLLSRQCKSTLGHGPKLPPSPLDWLIIGNLFDLGSMPHKSLAELRPKYDKVLWLRLGSLNTMVILWSKAATMLFKHHNLSFTSRAITHTSQAYDYYLSSVAIAPYDTYWRVMKRLMTNMRVNETASVWLRWVDQMLTWITEYSKEGSSAVQVVCFVFLMGFNLLGNLMLSKDLVDPDSEDGSEFFQAMSSLMEWSNDTNIAYLFVVGLGPPART